MNGHILLKDMNQSRISLTGGYIQHDRFNRMPFFERWHVLLEDM